MNTSEPLSHDQQARDHFCLLPHDQQRIAIRRLAAAGHGTHTIARATGLSAEMVRQPLRELQVSPNNAEAAQRLATIDEQIATLRESLRA